MKVFLQKALTGEVRGGIMKDGEHVSAREKNAPRDEQSPTDSGTEASMSLVLNQTLFDFSHTMAAPLLARTRYPHEAVSGIADFLLAIIPILPREEFTEISENVLVHKSARVAENAVLLPPTVICKDAEIRTGAYLRGACLIGEGAVVGNSSEIKNAILSDGAQVPHFNYVGDSILGYRAHMGAGAIASNLRSDGKSVKVDGVDTGMRKLGAALGNHAEIGCNSVLCPGCIVGENTVVYPLSRVRGILPANVICKGEGTPVPRINEKD